MPAGLDRTDRAILIAAAILLVVLVVASALVTPSRQDGGTGFPSTYSASWDGAKAAYLLLRDIGYNVQRWDEPPTELAGNPANEVLILANPQQFPTPEERAALRRFLEQGGRIVATGAMAAAFLPDSQPFKEGFDSDEEAQFPAVLPSSLSIGAPEISMIPPERWQPERMNQIVIYGNSETAAVVACAVGKGRVIWWGSPSPLTNRGIQKTGNLALFLNSLGPKEGHTVFWDEYFHGARGTLWSYVDKTPLPWVFAQFGFLFLFVLLARSRRYGPVRMPGKITRLSPLEFVDTLGDLYTAAHAGSAAVRESYQRLRFQLTRQLGLPANTTIAELARTASLTLGWEDEPLRGTLIRAERASRTIDLRDAEALAIAQDLYDYTALLETRRAKKETRKSE